MGESLVSVVLEKPVAGGRSLARIDGRVVLVSGGIPGERVRIGVERTGKGVAFGRVVEVEDASPDRVEPPADPQCGGLVFAHVAYPRQLALKRDIVIDALTRIGRLQGVPPIEAIESPVREWRLRARLHTEGARVGFFLEGTHTLCDASPSGQLVPGLLDVARGVMSRLRPESSRCIEAIVVSQPVAGGDAAAHLELRRPLPRHGEVWENGEPHDLPLSGVSAALTASRHPATLWGQPWIRESLPSLAAGAAADAYLLRHAAAFFQGNRALLPQLVARVLGDVRAAGGPVVDLYAGVGLFGVAAAAVGAPAVTCVEGDPISAEDLAGNCRRAGAHTRAVHSDVEGHVVRESRAMSEACVIVDPPRTGLAPTVTTAIAAARPRRVVYVSCDPATLARDLHGLTAGGLAIRSIAVADLFPMTAHVETVVTLASDA